MNTDKTKIVYKRKEDLLSSKMDLETVMMHPENGKYYSLNPVATRIWDLLMAPCSLNDIVNVLVSEFDVEMQICENETQEFIDKLFKSDLIEIVHK